MKEHTKYYDGPLMCSSCQKPIAGYFARYQGEPVHAECVPATGP